MTRLRLCLVQVGLCVLALFSLCEAIPPYPLKRRVVVKGPDGKDMPIFLKGDALSGRYETEDGYTVFEDPNQKDHWVYLREDTDYTWKDSTQPPTQKHLIPKRKAERMKRVLMARDIATGAPSNTASRWTLGASSSPETHTTVGERKVLVVGINFLDSKLKLSENAYWKTTFGESNSLKSFYERSSYKKLVVSPATEICGNKNNDGIAVVDLESTQPTVDTTEDDGMGNNFTSKVLEKLKACVDFESYDKNSDGVISADELTMIFVLPGREGAIACAQDKCHKTWAKYRYFGPLNQLSTNNKRIPGAVYIAELGDCECTQQNHYGVLCHEFAHSLGLPSLSSNNREEEEEEDTTLMKTGGWCTPEPCDLDPWSKAYLGWTQPRIIPSSSKDIDTEITENGLSPDSDVVQMTHNVNAADTFFLIEKRIGEVGPSVWQVKCTKEAPIVKLAARDSPRWDHNEKGGDCINFEVQGSSQLGKTLLLHFNSPKYSCRTNPNNREQNAINADQSVRESALHVEVVPVVNATTLLSPKDSPFASVLNHRRAQRQIKPLRHKAVPEPSPLLTIEEVKKNEAVPRRLAVKAVNEDDGDNDQCENEGGKTCGCNGNCNNCQNSCCCCCCCCGSGSCDKCSKYENKADYYWNCNETKCIPYNDEDDEPVPEDCSDDSSINLENESISVLDSDSDNSDDPDSSRSSISDSSNGSHESSGDDSSDGSSGDEDVMICSTFTYELSQSRNCLSSSQKSSLFEESSRISRSSSQSSTGGRGNGMHKNSAPGQRTNAFMKLSALLLLLL